MAKYNCPVCKKPCTDPEGCFFHKPRKPLKKTGRMSAWKKPMVKTQQEIEDSEKMWEVFHKIWKERGPWSELDDSYLGRRINSCFFDHLLPKETFPEVKFEEWNILLVSADQHTARHDGFPHPGYTAEIQRAKNIYNNLFSNC